MGTYVTILHKYFLYVDSEQMVSLTKPVTHVDTDPFKMHGFTVIIVSIFRYAVFHYLTGISTTLVGLM